MKSYVLTSRCCTRRPNTRAGMHQVSLEWVLGAHVPLKIGGGPCRTSTAEKLKAQFLQNRGFEMTVAQRDVRQSKTKIQTDLPRKATEEAPAPMFGVQRPTLLGLDDTKPQKPASPCLQYVKTHGHFRKKKPHNLPHRPSERRLRGLCRDASRTRLRCCRPLHLGSELGLS